MIAPKFNEKAKASYEETMRKSSQKSCHSDALSSALNELVRNKNKLTEFLHEIEKLPHNLNTSALGSNKDRKSGFKLDLAPLKAGIQQSTAQIKSSIGKVSQISSRPTKFFTLTSIS